MNLAPRAPRAALLALPALLAWVATGCAGMDLPTQEGIAPTVDLSAACGIAGTSPPTVEVGGVTRLNIPNAPGSYAAWTSSDLRVAQVYGSGFIVGLKPGTTWVSAGSSQPAARCPVSVVEPRRPTVDPGSLRQHQDDQRFETNGRACFGSELNGQRATSPEERQYTENNRVINPTPLDAAQRLDWEVEEGAEIYDGAGVLMGTVAQSLVTAGRRRVHTSKFNFGMSKILDGKMCLYAFSVEITPTPQVRRLAGPSLEGGTVRTSAWMPLDRVVQKDALLERIGIGKVSLPRLPLEATRLVITGGDPLRYMTEFGELRIVKDPDAEPVPSHYLRRPSGTVNIIYSVPGFGLGGQGLDSLLVSNGVVFRPAKGARVFVQPTYYPGRHPKRGQVSDKTMTFIYGAAEGKGVEPVYGWVAKEALAGE